MANASLSSETIERLRQSGVRINREGEPTHDGEIVRHQGLRAAILRWLDRLPDGRYVLRLDAQRFAYVQVEDTPLVARALRWEGDRAVLSLSDGNEELLNPSTLTVDASGVLRCLVRDGRLPARLSMSAAAVLAERIDDHGDRPTLWIGGGVRPL